MLYEIIKLAINALWSNKLRTFLSMLGIVVGVFTIILVFAIGQGAQKSIEEQYKNLSVTTIMVMPINTSSSTSKLSDKDAQELVKNAHYIDKATPIAQGRLLVSNGQNSEQFTILGVKANFLEISNLKLFDGKYFTQEDDKAKKKVAVLGYTVAETLFDDVKKAKGSTIFIGKKKFEVIGVFEPSGTSIGPISYDDTVFIPFDTAKKVVLGDNAIIRLIVLAKTINDIDNAILEIGEKLRKLHKLKASDPDDFRVKDQGSKVVAAKESAKTMEYLLIGVAMIVLIVSGIGIMNVMFAGVAERTKEIGILKSIGAKNSDILNQFLVESIIVSALGGILGILLGEIVIYFWDNAFDMILVRSNIGDIVGFTFSVLTGVFFGFYPAYKASKLDPVDALRN